MPHHLPTSSSTLPPPPAARHRHSGSAGTPDLSIWLSVDPLADKYPSMSPYTYCANNPVRLVDEDGRDIWELDECGNIINHIEDDMVDQFRIVDDKGKSINLPSGIDDNSGDIQMVRSRPGLKSYIYTRDKGYTEYNQDTYYKPLKIRCPSSLQK